MFKVRNCQPLTSMIFQEKLFSSYILLNDQRVSPLMEFNLVAFTSWDIGQYVCVIFYWLTKFYCLLFLENYFMLKLLYYRCFLKYFQNILKYYLLVEKEVFFQCLTFTFMKSQFLETLVFSQFQSISLRIIIF